MKALELDNAIEFEIKPVDHASGDDFQTLFESKGKLNNCRCMAYTIFGFPASSTRRFSQSISLIDPLPEQRFFFNDHDLQDVRLLSDNASSGSSWRLLMIRPLYFFCFLFRSLVGHLIISLQPSGHNSGNPYISLLDHDFALESGFRMNQFHL